MSFRDRIFATTSKMTIWKDSQYENCWEFDTTLKNETEVRKHLNEVFNFQGAMKFGKITMSSHGSGPNWGYVKIILNFELKEVKKE